MILWLGLGFITSTLFYFTFSTGFLFMSLVLVFGTYLFRQWFQKKREEHEDRFGSLFCSIQPEKGAISFSLEDPLFIFRIIKSPWIRSMVKKNHKPKEHDSYGCKENFLSKLIQENMDKESDETEQILWVIDHVDEFIHSLEGFSATFSQKQAAIHINVK